MSDMQRKITALVENIMLMLHSGELGHLVTSTDFDNRLDIKRAFDYVRIILQGGSPDMGYRSKLREYIFMIISNEITKARLYHDYSTEDLFTAVGLLKKKLMWWD
ncbi:MAG: hypothetical protein GF411_03090 [Candidatus Lokiarchaeota archaeon]|nr:hypothetical protein [Candidatus Lokiarchaeota archaeon]